MINPMSTRSKKTTNPETKSKTMEMIVLSSNTEEGIVQGGNAVRNPEEENAKVSQHEDSKKLIDQLENPAVAKVVATRPGGKTSLDKSYAEALSTTANILVAEEDDREFEMRVDTVEKAHSDKNSKITHLDKNSKMAHFDKNSKIAHFDRNSEIPHVDIEAEVSHTDKIDMDRLVHLYGPGKVKEMVADWLEKNVSFNDMSHAKLTPPNIHLSTPRVSKDRTFKKPETPQRSRNNLKPNSICVVGRVDGKEKVNTESLHRVGFMVVYIPEIPG